MKDEKSVKKTIYQFVIRRLILRKDEEPEEIRPAVFYDTRDIDDNTLIRWAREISPSVVSGYHVASKKKYCCRMNLADFYYNSESTLINE